MIPVFRPVLVLVLAVGLAAAPAAAAHPRVPASLAAVGAGDGPGVPLVASAVPTRVQPRRARAADQPAVIILVRSTGDEGVSPTDTDNDFTRISDALATLPSIGDGTTVLLQGTFDWTEPFAAADWALGPDGLPATGDEFSLYPPGGLQDVTLTADALGSAVIQGPGEQGEQDFESFITLWADGGFQGWSISNLDLRGFEWGIIMFWSSAVSDFNDVAILGNRIELPADLNETAAPADSFQNIALHVSFGTHQTIAGNEIVMPGTGVSDPDTGEKAASVALQSNTSGGTAYEGLLIENNVIRITGAQDVYPEWIYGIWENSSANDSNITVRGNWFLNESPGNVAAANRQRGFRVTSHSSATTTVAYEHNRVEGANEGFQWLGDGYVLTPPAGAGAVVLRSNTVVGNAFGVLVQSGNGNARADLAFNRIHGNGFGLVTNNGVALAENNWWGCNDGPSLGACDVAFPISGGLDADPWLVLGLTGAPVTLLPGQPADFTATLTGNSDGDDTSGLGFLPDGTPVAFAATGGTVDPAAAGTVDGVAGTTYTAGTIGGQFEIAATVDGETATGAIEILSADLFLDGFETGDTSRWTVTVP